VCVSVCAHVHLHNTHSHYDAPTSTSGRRAMILREAGGGPWCGSCCSCSHSWGGTSQPVGRYVQQPASQCQGQGGSPSIAHHTQASGQFLGTGPHHSTDRAIRGKQVCTSASSHACLMPHAPSWSTTRVGPKNSAAKAPPIAAACSKQKEVVHCRCACLRPGQGIACVFSKEGGGWNSPAAPDGGGRGAGRPP
jgi:hypothetical protein